MKKIILLLSISILAMGQMGCSMFAGDDDYDEGVGSEIVQETEKLDKGKEGQTADDTALDSEGEVASQSKEDSLDEGGLEDSSGSEGLAKSDDLDTDSAEELGDFDEPETDNIASQEEGSGDDFADEGGLGEDKGLVTEESAPEEELKAQNQESTEDMMADSSEKEDLAAGAVDTSGAPVTITGIDFRGNDNGGTIVVQTDGPAQYQTIDGSGNNQYIVELENAKIPEQFKRPYNTKEFSGPIGMINAYQKPGTNAVRIVVQLKSPTDVSVVQDGNSLLIVPGASVAQASPEPEVGEGEGVTSQVETSESTEPAVDMGGESSGALASKTLDEFLSGDTKFYGRKISIEVSDGSIRDVINFISEESGVNIILSDEVKGNVSVKLRQIPWDQALVVIMQTKQLGYIRQGNILRIAPLASIRSETDSAKQLVDAQKLLEPLKVKVIPISYAKAKDIEPQTKNFLSTRGSAQADERTNNLVVRDIGENIVKIEKLISRLDTQTPQVFIEGKIVETKTSLNKDFGVNWGATGNAQIQQGIFTNSLSKVGSLALSAELKIMETEDKVKVLSSPRIVTLNNEPANIEQSTQIPTYITSFDSLTNRETKTVEYKTIKLSLNVTPQITSEGGVILKTDILREFAGAADTIAPDTGARSINSRSAKTTILVNNGETAVLGGIYSMDNTDSTSGLPLLKDIPLIGSLFGLTKTTYDKNELLIFLTPRVINKDKAFQMGSNAPEAGDLF